MQPAAHGLRSPGRHIPTDARQLSAPDRSPRPSPLSRCCPSVAAAASCYLQPPKPSKKGGDEPPLGQVNIEHAFSSPENLAKCAEFLRAQAGEMRSQAAVIVTPKHKIGYPWCAQDNA